MKKWGARGEGDESTVGESPLLYAGHLRVKYGGVQACRNNDVYYYNM